MKLKCKIIIPRQITMNKFGKCFNAHQLVTWWAVTNNIRDNFITFEVK